MTFFKKQKIPKFFCKRINKIQGSTIQPLKTLKPCELTWPCRKLLKSGSFAKTWESFVFKKSCDWIIFFKVPQFKKLHCKKVTYMSSIQSCRHSHARSRVTSKIPSINLLFESWSMQLAVVDFRFVRLHFKTPLE